MRHPGMGWPGRASDMVPSMVGPHRRRRRLFACLDELKDLGGELRVHGAYSEHFSGGGAEARRLPAVAC